MAVFFLFLVVLFAISGHSIATYCVCKDGQSDAVYQKDIDYACGAGADCTPIQQNGACYNPNTVKDHCNYAVNSYFQKKAQVTGSCDFSGSANTATSLTSQQASTCVYPSSASSTTTPSTGTTTPTTTPTTGTTVPPPPATGTTTPGTGTGTGTTIGTPPSSIFGLGPTSITPTTENSRAQRPLFWAFTLLSGPLLFLSL